MGSWFLAFQSGSAGRRRGGSRRAARRVVTLLLLVLMPGCRWPEREREPIRHDWNVLIVTFDTTRADHLSCYGYQAITTPAVDSLAASGVRYTRCYATAPLTFPSHASMMTGLYPFYHGVRINGAAPLDGRFETLAEVLAASGRRTGAVIAAHVLEATYGLDQGFAFYHDQFNPSAGASEPKPIERRAADVTQVAIHWLNESPSQPYFLWVHYFDPHAPYAPPPGVNAPPGASDYDREIAYADSELGRLLDAVLEIERSTGRATLVVFAADHGEALWGHGEPTHSLFTYNETIRVPLIVRFPKSAGHVGVVNDPVSVADIYPSILHWIGLPQPYRVHGRVLPTESGDDGDSRPIYFETYMPYFMYGWSPLEGIVVGDRKFVDAPRPELYDLKVDNEERRNLIGAGDADVEAFRDELEDIKTTTLEIAPASHTTPIYDEETTRQLMALGYLSSSEPIAEDIKQRPDPKDRRRVHVQCEVVQTELDAGDDKTAASVLTDVLSQEPGSPRALFLLIDLFSRQAVRDDALALAAPILDDELPPPLDVQLPLRYAAAASMNGQLEEALRGYEFVLKRSPNDLTALNNAAWTAYELGQNPATALQWARKAAEIAPADEHVRHTLGAVLLWQGDQASIQSAREVLSALVHDSPGHASAHYYLGQAHAFFEDTASATAAYARAIELAGDSKPDWLNDARSRLDAMQGN